MLTDPTNQQAPEQGDRKTVAKQRALNALTFLLAAAVCGEGYLLWEMNDRVDQVLAKLDNLERNGTAADWKVIPNPESNSSTDNSAQDPAAQLSDPLLDPNYQFDPYTWDPFADIDRARKEMDQLMRQMRKGSVSFAPSAHVSSNSSFESLKLEDAGDTYVATIALPGVDESNVSVSIVNNRLSVVVKHQSNNSKSRGNSYARVSGQLMRSVTIPERVDEKSMTSCLKDGVLTITIPKL